MKLGAEISDQALNERINGQYVNKCCSLQYTVSFFIMLIGPQRQNLALLITCGIECCGTWITRTPITSSEEKFPN